MSKLSLTAIDLFAGAGGLSEGFRQAGFSILVANDFDEMAAETFRLNHSDSRFLGGPIGDLRTEQQHRLHALRFCGRTGQGNWSATPIAESNHRNKP